MSQPPARYQEPRQHTGGPLAPRTSLRSGHPVAAALTDGYVAGLLAGAVLFAAGAVVAIRTVNARISPAEAAAR